MIALRLIRAYRQAVYRFADGGRAIAFRPGDPAPAIDRLLAAERARTAIFITACNPRSIRQPPLVNAIRQRRLLADLRRGGWAVRHGEAGDTAGLWPAEPSLLAIGLDRCRADRLARRYGQNAYILLRRRRPPALIVKGGAPRV